MLPPQKNQIVLQGVGPRWLHFKDAAEIVVAREIHEVIPKLNHIEAAVRERGLHAAGFIAYEAAPAFEPAVQLCQHSTLPLLWFGLYPKPVAIDIPAKGAPGTYRLGEWRPNISVRDYQDAFDRIKDYIAQGDTYQVNFTLRLRSPFEGSAWDFFLDLARAQQADYCAFVDTGSFRVCSASPELFFRRTGDELLSRPMKGTAPRGRTLAEDREKIQWLQRSAKNRAENLMIVDMIRNDMGRIAQVGSVQVPSLFDIERYPTVLQMTSQVTARTRAGFSEIIAMLFPCASITGAPKVRTMQIIAELESEPRGVYTGCVGYLSPDGEAQFNVSIRSVVIEAASGMAELGVGGGIVWDSEGDDEYEECQIKARFLTRPLPDFELFESLLWEPDQGYFLLERHLRRMADSSVYLDFGVNIEQARRFLQDCASGLPAAPHKIRLLAERGGVLRVEAIPLGAKKSAGPLRVALAADPVDSSNPLLFHKTTHRSFYETALRKQPGYDDLLFWNERGELTESTRANVVVRLEGKLLTPSLECGLLGGTFRRRLLDEGTIQEAVIPIDRLEQAEAVYLINSVRKWMDVVLVRLPDDLPPHPSFLRDASAA